MRPLARLLLGVLLLAACSKDKPPEPSEKLFPTSAPEEKTANRAEAAPVFTQLTVVAKGVTATLERQGEAWRLTAPVQARADKWTVDNLIQQLQSAKFKATVSEAPTDPELVKYGLKPPVFSVTAHAYVPDGSGGGQDTPSRQRTVTLYGGVENSFDGSVFVRRDGDSRVYSAEGSVRYALEKDLYALRDKEVLGFDESALKLIEVTAPAGGYTLERDTPQSWRLTKPTAVRADTDRVKQALKSLREQRALSYPADSAGERTKLGLDKPVVDARFTLSQAEPVRVRLSQVKDADGVKVYALREQGSEATLAEVAETALAVLDLSVAELRTKALLSFKREDVKRLVFHPGGTGTPFTVTDTSPDSNSLNGWRVEAGKAQGLKVASVLSLLGNMKASTFGEPHPKKWDKYGITESSRGVSLQDANGKELARLWIGSAVPDKEGLLYARGSIDEVAEIEQAWAESLPEQPQALLEAGPGTAKDGGSGAEGH